jgi:phospho-N-acetylmuramoyl-pentapeptide-transferase
VLVVFGTATGVNLSDGLDGLAAGLLIAAFAGMAAVLAIVGDRALWVAAAPSPGALALCSAAAGAAAGFLVFNRHPARVFMGNVASLALGALLGTVALASGTWPLLAIVGGVFAAEVVSDVIQVGYFKATGGRRFFRMAPLHHHFEKGGWPEQKVVRRFWAGGALCAALGAALATI